MENFPLYWPIGYKRSDKRIRSRFTVTMDKAQKLLRAEVNRMGGKNLIVSSNIPIRQDGHMYADWMNRKIEDSGVAIYFKLDGKDVVMCCDQYEKVYENVYALAKGIEALRGIDRWGISEFIERAFDGFKGLPEPKKKAWHEVLGVSPKANHIEIRDAYYALVKIHHPDKGGDIDKYHEIREAYSNAPNQ